MAVVTSAKETVTTMQSDLQRALQKSEKTRSWAMAIDIRKCIGCQACTAACVVENVLPPGVTYRHVHFEEATLSNRSHVQSIPMPTNCFQCEKPPCVKAANKVSRGSFRKRPDGIVEINYKRAKRRGDKVFQAARKACPYTFALYFDDGKYYTDKTTGGIQQWESRRNYEYNREWHREDIIGSPRKCHFCLHRISAGELPACVSTCVGRAIFFGDLNDSASLISTILNSESSKVMRVREKAGTKPRMYYLTETPSECAAQH